MARLLASFGVFAPATRMIGSVNAAVVLWVCVSLAQTQPPDPATLIGTWHGTSVCTDRVAAPACNDEEVVYEFTRGDKPGLVHWIADKIVNGQRQRMGELDLSYEEAESCWKAEFNGRVKSVWRLSVDGDHLTGTARLVPGNETIRKLDVRRGGGPRKLRLGSTSDAPMAFASKRDGNWEIYSLDSAGRSTRLTRRDGFEDRFPMWSPDRTKIAFASTTGRSGDGWDLWVIDADGSNAHRLHSGIVAKSSRAWSHDGKQIVFTTLADGNLDIAVVDVPSARTTRLTMGADEERDPCWSPDGRQIAFASTRNGNSDIYVMQADGADVRRLTNDSAFDGTPVWSPDGTRIAFISKRDGASDVYTIQPNGQGLERLTVNASVTKDSSRWSPDSSLLAFQMARGENYDIGVVRVRDRRRIDLADSSAYDGMFTWSPDGGHLAFVSSRDGYDALYRTDVDGRHATRLTDTPTLNPSWAPR